MTPEPDVTVVVCVWDDYVPRFLDEALASVLAQDLPIRLLIVDNASALPVAPHADAELLRTDARVSVGAARNAGLRAVSTPYAVMWDADDLMLPGTLRRLRDCFREDPSTTLAVTSIIEEPGHVASHWPRKGTAALTRWRGVFAAANAVSSMVPTTGSAMFPVAAALDSGGFADADGGDDWVLGVSLAVRGGVRVLADPGRVYRRHADSISAQWKGRPHIAEHGRLVRCRLREDAAVPAWLRAASPAVLAGQQLVISLLRPLSRARRS